MPAASPRAPQPPIDLRRLRQMDLNLLLVLRMLLGTCSVSETARRLDSTQPSISRMLDRLRRELGDPLLVKSSNSMIRSSRGEQLQPLLDQLIELLEGVYRPPSDYRVVDEQRTCTIGSNDALQATFAAPLIAAFRQRAPNAQLRFKPVPYPNPGLSLQNGEIDVLLGMAAQEDPAFRSTVLFQSDFACMCATHNSAIGHTITVKELAGQPYLDVSHIGTISALTDAMFNAVGLRKRTVATMSSFLAAAGVVADSDLVCLAPSYLTPFLASHPGIRLVPLTGQQGVHPIRMIWHNTTHFDGFMGTVRDMLVQIVAELRLAAT